MKLVLILTTKDVVKNNTVKMISLLYHIAVLYTSIIIHTFKSFNISVIFFMYFEVIKGHKYV